MLDEDERELFRALQLESEAEVAQVKLLLITGLTRFPYTNPRIDPSTWSEQAFFGIELDDSQELKMRKRYEWAIVHLPKRKPHLAITVDEVARQLGIVS